MDTTKTIGGVDSQGFAVNVPYTGNANIPVSSIAPTTPVPITAPQYKDYSSGIANNLSYTQSAFDNAQANVDALNSQAQAANSDLAKLVSQTGAKSADTGSAMQQTGATNLAAEIRKLNAQSAALAMDTQAKTLAEQNKATGQNITSQAVQRNTADATRENFINQANIAMQVAIKQADYQTAKDLAEQIVNAKYDQLEADLKAKQINLQGLKDYSLTPAEKKLADAQSLLLKQQEQVLADQKETEKSLQTLALNVSKNYPNVSPSVLSSITNAKTFNDAVIAASPYMQSLADKADLNYKLAQTAEIYNKIKNDTSIGTDPASALAYAQQYASTGQIPTGMPKGSFGAIAQYAKELPRPTGEIVNRATGVKPAGSEAQVTAMSALVSAVELAKQLQELDKQRWGGLVAGTAGKVFGSADQQRYIDLKKQIVDLLARARTGAAMTASEEKFYGDMLPGRFSEPLGLGTDSSVKIDNFVNNLSKDLQTKANAQGWSIYGYSTVKTDDGVERTVGSIVQSPDGRTGRVNPDGSITLIQ